jgi:hypothetical protein
MCLLLSPDYADFCTKDKFGLSPLQLATKNGYHAVRNLLLQTAKERDITLEDVPADFDIRLWRTGCVFCLLPVQSEVYYQCSSCGFYGEAFDICKLCVQRGLRCINPSHELKEVDEL